MISEVAALHKFAAEQARLQAAMEEAGDGDGLPMPDVHRKLMAALRLRCDLKRAWSYDGREPERRKRRCWPRPPAARAVPRKRRPWSAFSNCLMRLRSRRVAPHVHGNQISALAVTLTAPSLLVQP